jgi:hypothetical protein
VTAVCVYKTLYCIFVNWVVEAASKVGYVRTPTQDPNSNDNSFSVHLQNPKVNGPIGVDTRDTRQSRLGLPSGISRPGFVHPGSKFSERHFRQDSARADIHLGDQKAFTRLATAGARARI